MKLGLKLSLATSNRQSTLTPGLLDQYGDGIVAAYSLRYLTNSYTGSVITVRRSSDDSVQSFTPSEITDGSLEAFVGVSTDWYITDVYDQIGSNHLSQSSPTRQPKIGASSSLIGLNGMPAIQSNGTSDVLQSPAGVLGNVSSLSAFLVGAFTATGLSNSVSVGINDGANGGGNNYILLRQLSGSNQFVLAAPSNSRNVVGSFASTTQKIYWLNYVSSSRIRLGINGVDYTNSTSIPASINLTQNLNIFASVSGTTPSLFSPFNFQELIIWDSDLTDDRVAIETAINSYYSTY